MNKQNIYKVIGVFEFATGIVGIGVLLWALVTSSVVSSATVLYSLYLIFAILFILAGILLFKRKIVGVWLSILAQLIAIPSYASNELSFAFNNIFRFRAHISTNEAMVGFDLFAAIVFFYLVLSLPTSTKASEENEQKA